MTSDRIAAIVGVAESDLGYTPGKTVLQLQAQAAKAALAEAGFTKDDVDAVFTAGNWAWAPNLMLAEYLGIQPKFTDGTNIGGSSFEAHVGHAMAGIKAGLFDVALITYGSTQKSNRGRMAMSPYVTLTEQFERWCGLPTPVGAYAMAAMRHMHQYGTTSEQLAEIAVATRKWATMNEKAMMRDPITIDDVLNSRWIAEPLHLLDCCLVTDGGGAVVVASKQAAARAKTKPVWILGHGETHTHNSIVNMPDLTVTGARESGRKAFEMAGIGHHEIDVAEIYDSFTITVLLTLEALGFCQFGEGGAFVSGGRTAPGGDFPMNTNGGGLSYCHPGMYGIYLLIEAARQLRGECGDRQVADAKIALVNGTGGVLSSTSTVILGRD
ncbi:acetyl-CoA acetyltransferase [Alicyclobacillus fastidiosus]|uniref:Acetyl-CoA acetyltransferase n=1 Tax=Alicyclobacillus fastidiosus TaxID=392011 RepID=A0ABY6ZGQ6_9BACL|nr:acetyl-CoA acetyltransferase [Alicyclobacillus fastidiosus]WAH42016.1 acetyl-CoA acetyltransferase [Alicyclobacillus fastidiosus]GMA63760.1 thiolase [Alicyclobacillus fastidiosus]